MNIQQVGMANNRQNGQLGLGEKECAMMEL